MIKKGTNVILCDLKNQSSLNNCSGVVISDILINNPEDRIAVNISGQSKKVRRKNLYHNDYNTLDLEVATNHKLPGSIIIINTLREYYDYNEIAILLYYKKDSIWNMFLECGGVKHIDPKKLSIFANASTIPNGPPYRDQIDVLDKLINALRKYKQDTN